LDKGTEEEVYSEYANILNQLEQAKNFQHNLYIKGKQLAACIVKKGWITEREIEVVIEEELNKDWFSLNGILNVYMLGLLGLEKYVPVLASLLDSDDDILLEEVAFALISFQSDQVVKEVKPYLLKEESIIFAASVLENIKNDRAVNALREAYRKTGEIENQDLLIEALCHHLSLEALPEISEHMKKEYTSNLVDIEHIGYSYYSILGLEHPDLEVWKRAVLYRDHESLQETLLTTVPIRNEHKIGRNDPCPCGSGKKYKKCCGSV
jgi:hypothetical protein